jgi:transcriptional regulator with XRE-family HTH domain
MSLGKNIQEFLTQKITDMKIKKKDFIMKCGLTQPIFNKMMQGRFANPKLTTLAKLANFCNTSIDEILGRETQYYKNKHNNFQHIDSDIIAENLLSVVHKTMTNHKISAAQLSNRIYVSTNTLVKFLERGAKSVPGAATTLALANFLDASIDDMIGRRPPSRTQEQKQDIPKQLNSLSKQDLDMLADIKNSVKSSAPQNQNIKKTTSTKHLNKQKDEGRGR